MYNNKNTFESIPAPPPPPDPSFGMAWPGNHQMMQPMMTQMMQPMMPGIMQGYNFVPSNDQNPNMNQGMMQNSHPSALLPPPIPISSLETATITNKDSNMVPMTSVYAQQPNSVSIITSNENKDEAADPTHPNENRVRPESQKRARSRSPRGRDNESNRRRDSDRSGDRVRRDNASSSNRRGDERRRSRSRDRPRRERRSKWDSGDKEGGKGRGPNAGMEGMLMPPAGGIMPAAMFPGNMHPVNMEMMGQAQLEMMKGQQMGMQAMNPGIMMVDPSMMGMQNHMYSQMYNQPLVLSAGVLEPPYPGTALPQRRARPTGCRTIFVGGLPESVSEETVKQIFERFGKICTMRLRKGFCHVRFEQENSVEASFALTGYRLILKDSHSTDNISSGLLIDYALNRDDQQECERSRQPARGAAAAPRIEHISCMSTVSDKIKNEEKFAEAVPTLIAWLEGGECSKKNANTFYSMIQATNNHTRRLMNDKMLFDEEVQQMKEKLKERGITIVTQLEQVVKVLSAANHKRVWDHFTKVQRKNVETWLKMSEELSTVKDEFSEFFNEDETDFSQKKAHSEQLYNEIKAENENLILELDACKNEVHEAKTEAAREFEKLKAHFIAEQALISARSGNKMPVRISPLRPPPPPPPPESEYEAPTKSSSTAGAVHPGEARLITLVSMFLLVHPHGASLDYVLSYVRTLYPDTAQDTLRNILTKHTDVFIQKKTGVGAQMTYKWTYAPIQLPMQHV